MKEKYKRPVVSGAPARFAQRLSEQRTSERDATSKGRWDGQIWSLEFRSGVRAFSAHLPCLAWPGMAWVWSGLVWPRLASPAGIKRERSRYKTLDKWQREQNEKKKRASIPIHDKKKKKKTKAIQRHLYANSLVHTYLQACTPYSGVGRSVPMPYAAHVAQQQAAWEPTAFHCTCGCLPACLPACLGRRVLVRPKDERYSQAR